MKKNLLVSYLTRRFFIFTFPWIISRSFVQDTKNFENIDIKY
ncbi:hypothetical protein ACJDU8_18605 [Clostridium sp. WILCCON 0269]|uniref:Uncharacterized protein n=1 Tax=Candidatus Clostridium eludens TaxID=3381663 RepID=A0ABW8SQY1_9CLOT